ncbi:putative oxidoreductase [Sphingomonas changbaiensis NBRC 104936]|uniref:Putative oxidoreductase n=1 Tax=Sphingomonas changbaiensis NBRC 104936 TaxID=1219043 RepID=A0A0E9MNW8_9SPHN|nr:2OG-Fe(II) oxygenase [Sphingomonas changbaiensis]GAO38825.1 putative oxidoreductase [Sphingomonas changbaiensis NBRC 104936]
MAQVPLHPMLQQAVQLSVAGRNAEAVLIVTRLAAQNQPQALAMLAEMKWRGGMVPQDPPAARELYRRASALGHAQSAEITTNLMANGVAGPRDWQGALARLRTEARKGGGRKLALSLIDKMALTDDGDPARMPEAQTLSERPDVRRIERLFTAAECDYLRQIAEPQYMPSVVNDGMGRQVRDPIRTSDGATLHWLIEDPVVHALNRRLAAASGTSFEQGEATLILRYKGGQEYKPHFDFVRSEQNQRFKTVLVYLNHDYQGGETVFPEIGLSVKARKGDALIFTSALPDRSVDPLSKHAGMPITGGVKYLCTKWIREKRWVA